VIVGCIQARMGSTRLPGKVLRELGGLSTLAWVTRALDAAAVCDEVVVATSDRPGDDAVEAEAVRLGAEVLRGHPDDVLSRYVAVARRFGADRVVRVTADNPLIDPAVVRDCTLRDGSVDLVTTGPPDSLPVGLDVEVVTRDCLQRLDRAATGHYRSHVTAWAYDHPGDFHLEVVRYHPDASDLRVTLDTPEDAACIGSVVEHLGEGPYGWREVVRLLRDHPEITALNAGIHQKPVSAG